MGTLNIAEWTPEQVADWMSGLGPTVAQYIPGLRERGLNGTKLLTLRCDDLEYLGIHVIGHQELLLEAVEHLRNYQYEARRECVQQLALRVSAAAGALARALRHHVDARLETHTLADVARTVHAVKPLVCWLDRWPLCSGAPLAERKAALLKLSLEAATCAQRDRFAEQPARAVAAAAAAAAAVADYIIQDVLDPMILQPAWVDTVTLAQGERALGFEVLPSFCGHHQLAHIRFGSPAHASGAVHEGDEILQVGGRCVIGWCGEAVERWCAGAARAAAGELSVRLRRRGAPPLPARAPPPPPHRYRPLRAPHPLHPLHPPPPHHLRRYEMDFRRTEARPERITRVTENETDAESASETTSARPPSPHSSDDSDALSPPASPTLHLDTARMYPPKPRGPVRRRHTVGGASPAARRPHLAIEFWHELQRRHWERDDPADDSALYRRDKAVSCSTGLQLSPRPRTCLGVPAPAPSPTPTPTSALGRGKLDKSHSTPAYDLDNREPGPLTTQTIPESPTTPTAPAAPVTPATPATPAAPAAPAPPAAPVAPATPEPRQVKAGQILEFKKSSSQIAEAILRGRRPPAGDPIRAIDDDSAEEAADVPETPVAEVAELEVADVSDASEVIEVAEAVNPVLTERRQESDSAIVSRMVMDDSSVDERIFALKHPKPRITERWKPADVPPEPPPRPASTQRTRERHRDLGPTLAELSDSPGRDSSFIIPVPVRELARESPLSVSSPLSSPIADVRDLPVVRDMRDMWDARDVRDGRDVREAILSQYPVLRMVPRTPDTRDLSPLKPLRIVDPSQISVPLRHITKHDIKLLSTERREMPPINGEPEPPEPPAGPQVPPAAPPATPAPPAGPPLDALQRAALSPTGSVVRGIFPSSKSRSLKKKNSILAKRRDVSARSLASRGVSGDVWQRVRASPAAPPRWAPRHLLLAHNLLYAYRTPQCSRADCMIYLEGFTACAAAEVKSRAHAFKVYHTGTAFYFACHSRDAMAAWIHLIHRATLLPSLAHNMELSKQYSETDYSETESDTENSEKRSEREREREKEKEKEKDKSKFGSLKKLTHRMQRSESQENVSHSSTSLDRKYLRFFSRNRNKDDTKAPKGKQINVPVPTEHYRSYRRAPGPGPAVSPAGPAVSPAGPAVSPAGPAVSPAGPAPVSAPAPTVSPAPPSPDVSPPPEPERRRIPKPINYIHASNPNLLDFEKSDFVTKPAIQVPKPKAAVSKADKLVGLVTLEEFMLQKQEEERRQVYTDRVLMGIQRHPHHQDKRAAKDLQKRLDRIVPDVIYGELPPDLPPHLPPHQPPPPPPARDKPISVKGKDGYEKIVYPADSWRDSLRRNDKVHSGSATAASPPTADSWAGVASSGAGGGAGGSAGGAGGAGGGAGGAGVSRLRLMFGGGRRDSTTAQEAARGAQYPHLQCPPTFRPETYCLARLAPPAPPASPPHRPSPPPTPPRARPPHAH